MEGRVSCPLSRPDDGNCLVRAGTLLAWRGVRHRTTFLARPATAAAQQTQMVGSDRPVDRRFSCRQERRGNTARMFRLQPPRNAAASALPPPRGMASAHPTLGRGPSAARARRRPGRHSLGAFHGHEPHCNEDGVSPRGVPGQPSEPLHPRFLSHPFRMARSEPGPHHRGAPLSGRTFGNWPGGTFRSRQGRTRASRPSH